MIGEPERHVPALPSIGGRTYLRVEGIAPRYAGTLYDVFAGG